MSSSEQAPVRVVWYNRGIRSPQLTLKNMDRFVRAQIKEQIPSAANTVYTPVSYEDTQEIYHAPGPSSTGLMDAPFIGVATFLKIAIRPGVSGAGQAAVVLKDANQLIALTPGHTQTPCSMMFPAAILPPNAFEDGFDMNDPTHHIGLIRENIEIRYLISYWKKTTA
ncbi:hypothetical protein B0H12DRAFT_1090894 [Mycena haematopus]|nr:hypothetical protein B0H12DRAFT_1090894 [Mycena haematopus]